MAILILMSQHLRFICQFESQMFVEFEKQKLFFFFLFFWNSYVRSFLHIVAFCQLWFYLNVLCNHECN